MKTLGIIGGLGPETTAEFYLDVIFSCQKKNTTQRPHILISSVPLQFKIEEDLLFQGIGIEKYLPFLVAEAKRLKKAGADFLVIPCNSVHVFIQEVRQAVSIPVLSIIEESIKFLKKEGIKNIGLVSTSVTVQNRLYETALEENGIGCSKPDDYQQAKLGRCIHNLVSGKQSNREREELMRIINDFESKQVDCVLLACTDLQLLIPQHNLLKIIDTMKIFADATVEHLLIQ